MLSYIKKKYKKLKIFDRLIIFLGILGLVFFAIYFFRKPTYITATIKVYDDTTFYGPWKKDSGTPAWFEQNFYEGMRELDGLGRVTAELKSVYSYDRGPSYKSVYLTTKLNAVWNRATNQYTYKGKPLIIGSTVKINFDRVYVEGLITQVEGFPDHRQKVNLRIEAQVLENNLVFPESEGIRKAVADAIKTGDVVKDSSGAEIIRIVDKKDVNAKKITSSSDGSVNVGENPLRKEVYLTLNISAYKLYGKYYLFDDIPVIIGASIPLSTVEYSVFPEVTKITENDRK